MGAMVRKAKITARLDPNTPLPRPAASWIAVGAHPFRKPAATGNGQLAPELAAKHARSVRHATGLRAARVRGRGARDGRVQGRDDRRCVVEGARRLARAACALTAMRRWS
jgi:hypothetical protein